MLDYQRVHNITNMYNSIQFLNIETCPMDKNSNYTSYSSHICTDVSHLFGINLQVSSQMIDSLPSRCSICQQIFQVLGKGGIGSI